MLGFHIVFPGLFTTIFKPYVGPISKRTAIPLGILLLALSGTGFFAATQMPYKPYLPGTVVAEEDWEKLSPRDFNLMMNEQKDRERNSR